MPEEVPALVPRQNYELVKLLLVGDSGVGKSSLIHRYTDDDFLDHFLSTVGVDFKMKMETIGAKNIKLQVWDTAGQERYCNIPEQYYRKVMGIVLVYNSSEVASFENCHNWMRQIKTHTSSVEKILVGNKIDFPRMVSRERVQAMAEEFGIPFVETSAKTGEGVQEMFHTLIKQIVDKKDDSKNLVDSFMLARDEHANCGKHLWRVLDCCL
eukprot:GEMP01080276.1.p1 GENE.GEMP01080276.1~~GEMP01080276.1.p1  ORF type:complete len:211 (+),score=32.92 GEMP01080276.1:110-742(+)